MTYVPERHYRDMALALTGAEHTSELSARFHLETLLQAWDRFKRDWPIPGWNETRAELLREALEVEP